MIAAGLMRALARRPIWPLAIAGVAAAPLVLQAPALAGPASGARVVTSCGGGVSVVTVRLPVGFDPLTATSAQLAVNDLPLRPSGRVQLAAWRKFVTGGVRAVPASCAFGPVTLSSAPQSLVGDAQPGSLVGDAQPGSLVGDAQPGSLVGDAQPGSLVGDAQPGSLVGDAQPGSLVGDAQPASMVGDAQPALGALTPPATAPRPSPGGNRASAATRTVVYGTWRVTRPKHDATAAVSSWAGLGPGRAGSPLVQAGSSAGGYFGPYLWWRVVPQRPNEQRISLDTAAGDTVYVRIELAHGQATVTIRDESTGAGGTYVLQYRRLDG